MTDAPAGSPKMGSWIKTHKNEAILAGGGIVVAIALYVKSKNASSSSGTAATQSYANPATVADTTATDAYSGLENQVLGLQQAFLGLAGQGAAAAPATTTAAAARRRGPHGRLAGMGRSHRWRGRGRQHLRRRRPALPVERRGQRLGPGQRDSGRPDPGRARGLLRPHPAGGREPGRLGQTGLRPGLMTATPSIPTWEWTDLQNLGPRRAVRGQPHRPRRHRPGRELGPGRGSPTRRAMAAGSAWGSIRPTRPAVTGALMGETSQGEFQPRPHRRQRLQLRTCPRPGGTPSRPRKSTSRAAPRDRPRGPRSSRAFSGAHRPVVGGHRPGSARRSQRPDGQPQRQPARPVRDPFDRRRRRRLGHGRGRAALPGQGHPASGPAWPSSSWPPGRPLPRPSRRAPLTPRLSPPWRRHEHRRRAPPFLPPGPPADLDRPVRDPARPGREQAHPALGAEAPGPGDPGRSGDAVAAAERPAPRGDLLGDQGPAGQRRPLHRGPGHPGLGRGHPQPARGHRGLHHHQPQPLPADYGELVGERPEPGRRDRGQADPAGHVPDHRRSRERGPASGPRRRLLRPHRLPAGPARGGRPCGLAQGGIILPPGQTATQTTQFVAGNLQPHRRRPQRFGRTRPARCSSPSTVSHPRVYLSDLNGTLCRSGYPLPGRARPRTVANAVAPTSCRPSSRWWPGSPPATYGVDLVAG